MDIFKKLKTNLTTFPLLKKKGILVVDDTVGISLLVATHFLDKKDNYLLIAPNLYKAQQIYNLLTSFINNEEVLLFPNDELIRAEMAAQSKEMVANRVYVLSQTLNNKKKIIVTNLSGSLRYLPNVDLFKKSVIKFKVGESYDISQLKKDLIRSGYSHVNKIDASLQFAARGDILDIFSVNYDNPIRIEFFGDEIDSIRFFDIVKQTSISKVDEVELLPGSDFILSDEEVFSAQSVIDREINKNSGVLPLEILEKLKINTSNDMNKIIEGQLDQSVYKYFSLLSKKTCTIFDYCNDYKKITINKGQIENSNSLLMDESWSYLNELFESGKCLNGLSLYQDFKSALFSHNNDIVFTDTIYSSPSDTIINIKSVPFQANKREDAINIIHQYLNDSYKVIVALDNKEHSYLIQEALSNANLTYQSVDGLTIPSKENIGICIYSLPSGFVLDEEKVVVLTSKELLNIKIRSSRFTNKFKEATILKSYEDLNPGDYVVHEYQGIGQFIELQTLEVEGVHKDFLKIAYFGGELLYVPLNQFQLVRKYMGKDGYSPRLSHLHSSDWENTKKKIKQRIDDLANRLMNLYVERSKIKGFAFEPDDEIQEAFESDFPHTLTPDQDKSLKEIKADMQSTHPMDRLLCGDVGFGKTEIAFRAAFKAILSGKQVAILCPTTLLARQHYELAKQRFEKYGVRVGHLSRLVPEKEQQKYISMANNGDLQLIIGTHRVLSKDLGFKDLGLLIIDEEQRFGVEQKEKIKELKTNLDVLTLSATPIPRTLQISLLGVRQLSQITTPPQNRMPIQTYVLPFNFDIVKELIERELGRNGQVFFLHNQVDDIYQFANKLQKLIPSSSVGVVHGQMVKSDIEDIMLRFYNNEINVLVCTSIVENGIDVPNANMIIVQDSERYGLSQLYQIKGRVGRSDRIAYAYLMFPEHKKLTEATQKRLQTLQEFTELGSGYKIAQRDLMIRGAGDVLGPEQAGFIDNIGLDMYIKLLNESVQEKLNGEIPTKQEIKLNNEIAVDAYIPSSYASDSDKIELYQEINSCETADQLIIVKQKTIDIYGKLPKEVELLFDKKFVDVLSKAAQVRSLSENANYINFNLSDTFSTIRGIGNILFETLIPYIAYTKIEYKNHEFRFTMKKVNGWLDSLIGLLTSLSNIYKINKVKEEDKWD